MSSSSTYGIHDYHEKEVGRVAQPWKLNKGCWSELSQDLKIIIRNTERHHLSDAQKKKNDIGVGEQLMNTYNDLSYPL